MIKTITLVLLLVSLYSLPSLCYQQEKVTVITQSAAIYAESNEHSNKIDRAKMGDVLTLFGPWKGQKEWLYVIFRSKRWKGEITGFIKSSVVVRGETIPNELLKMTAETEARMPADDPQANEANTEEKKGKRGELPSLKEAFKLEPAELKAEADVRKREERKPEFKEVTAEPEMARAEDESKPGKKEEVTEPAVHNELAIKKEPKPVEVKYLAETEISESQQVSLPETAGKESSIYEIEKALPSARDAKEAGARIEAGEEFKSEGVLSSPITEEPKTEPETAPYHRPGREPGTQIDSENEIKSEHNPKLELEPEITPVKIIEILVESEIPPLRAVAEAETLASDLRPYAIISYREESQELKIRKEEVKAVTEAEPAQFNVVPYEIKSKRSETETKAEAETKISEDAAVPSTVNVKPEDSTSERQEASPVQQRKPPQELIKPKMSSIKRIGLLTIGFGYGPSYGGFGASLQLNTKSGFSIHAGAGYYPATYVYSDYDWLKNQILFSAGIKYYLPFKSEKARPYFDLQYGGLTVEAVQVPIGYYEGVPILENIQKSLYGVSLLGGLELRFGRTGAKGALGFSYNTTEWEYWDRDLFLTGEFAIIVNF